MEDKILVVDDEPEIRTVVSETLKRENFRPVTACSGSEAHDMVLSEDPDLLLLDINLPDISGTDLFREVREQWDIPTIFVSARTDDIDRIVGLELGADDYISKPFNPRELLARIKAVLRRTRPATSLSEVSEVQVQHPPDSIRQLGPLRMDFAERRVYWRDEEIELTKKQFDLLAVFLERPKRVLSRNQLIEEAYDDAIVSDRTIDSHIRHIRDKFEEAGGDPIKTVRGVGFKLDVE